MALESCNLIYHVAAPCNEYRQGSMCLAALMILVSIMNVLSVAIIYKFKFSILNLL